MMDGSLEADGKTVASYEYNVDVSREVVKFSHSIGVTVEAELGVLGSLETMQGDKEDGHGADGKMTREQLFALAEERGIKVHGASGADKVRAALRSASA